MGVQVNRRKISSPGFQLNGDSEVNLTEVTLTADQIKAMRATPPQLVPAPGAGKMVEFLSAVLVLNATATAFTELTLNMAVKYTDGAGAAVSQAIEATGFIDQVANTVTNALPKIDAIVAKAAAENKALVLHNTGAGEYTVGTGTLKVRTSYRIHSV